MKKGISLSLPVRYPVTLRWMVCVAMLLFTIAAITSCNRIQPHGYPRKSHAGASFVKVLLDSLTNPDFELYTAKTIRTAYDIYDYNLLWSDGNCVTPQGRTLLSIIDNCDKYGLFPGDFHETELCSINPDELNAVTAARLDVLLTDSYFALAWQLKHGTLDPRTYAPYNLSRKVDTLGIISLHHALKASSMKDHLSAMEPDHVFYRSLRARLKALHTCLDSLPGDMEAEDELRLISVNLERWRWEFKSFPDEYIFVNIPSAMLYVFKGNEIIIQSRVIVGSPDNPTPVFSSKIECFVLFPYWHVPHKIAVTELLPEFKKEPDKARKQNFEVIDSKGTVVDPLKIDWRAVNQDNFSFRLRQREGEGNALGIIKFSFDNPYGVYLHDTNARHLFTRKDRALSHGCIRMERPLDLALYLTRDEVTPTQMKQWIRDGRRREVNLSQPMPLYVTYFTHDGENGYPDIYKRNEKLSKAIMNPAFSLILAKETPASEPVSPASGGQ